MKTALKLFKLATTGLLLTSLALNFNACTESSPLSPADSDKNVSLNKKGGKGKGKGNAGGETDNGGNTIDFPISASKKYRFNKQENEYRGGEFEFNQESKSKFKLDDGALTPPANIDWGKPVTITMEVDYDEDKKELIFTFGPHGCQFNPQAEIKLGYGVLGVDVPVLYYIDDDGNYIEQTPAHIDVNKKWLKINVDHFSRYAVAWSQ